MPHVILAARHGTAACNLQQSERNSFTKERPKSGTICWQFRTSCVNLLRKDGKMASRRFVISFTVGHKNVPLCFWLTPMFLGRFIHSQYQWNWNKYSTTYLLCDPYLALQQRASHDGALYKTMYLLPFISWLDDVMPASRRTSPTFTYFTELLFKIKYVILWV